MYCTIDPLIKDTNVSHPPDQDNPELFNQKDHSANVKMNKEAEQEQEKDIEFQ